MQHERQGARAGQRNETGFTLIELMVVVLIISILIAVLIPVFLGASNRARDRATQADLRNGLTAEKTVFTDNQTYSNDTSTAGMKGVETALDWGGKLTVVVGDAVNTGDKGVVCLTEASKSGKTFSIGDVASGPNAGTYFGKAACPGTIDAPSVAGLGTGW
jgi:prepilin-type N-terminal cleavage/methylation domain-containing protein